MGERKPTIDFAVRPFQPADIDRVRWLFARTPPWGRTYPQPQALPEDLEDIPANYPVGSFVAVEDDLGGEAIIGFTAVALPADGELPNFIDRGRTTGRIRWLSVAPERWRLGVGRRLTEAGVDRLREVGCEAVVLETTIQQEGAIALYESLGFKVRGHTTVGRWRQVWMELVL